jgi:pyruvate/2-oxoglutarate/acetoin dehydrogenase E1 component
MTELRRAVGLRTVGSTGVGLAMAAQHSQSLESMLMGIPGLIVAAPGRARDARALLKSAIRSENPVIFFEHKRCYLEEGEVPEQEELLPFGKADIVRPGGGLTIVSLLYTVYQALEAARELAREGIEAEVIDLRPLSPLDTNTVLGSVSRTGRLLTMEEGPIRGGWGAEVLARVVSAGLAPLRRPPVRLGAGDHPIPYNRNLENLSVPDVRRIVEAARGLAG